MGFAADFCPLCRNIQTFAICRATVRESLSMSPTGTADDGPAFHQVCQCCQARMPSDPSLFATLRQRPDDVLELMDSTNPGIGDTYGQRFDLEERLSHSPRGIPREQRLALLYEPFATLAWEVDELFARTPRYSYATLFAWALPLLALDYFLETTVTPLLLLGVALALWFAYRACHLSQRPRVLRTRIIPLLAKALAPLRPSRRELDDVLKMMEDLGHQIGTRVLTSDLLVAMPQSSRRRRNNNPAT